ncbi:MAG: AAA family ATPase [Bacillota bacterium]|nr:AAA family ATPase [Bacillota bacterium]
MQAEIDEKDVSAFLDVYSRVEKEISKVIVGQREVIEQVLAALFAGGHVLLEGVPGLGKTALVRTIGRVLDLSFSRIQFTPDLMPADIIGTNIIIESGGSRQFEFQRGPVFANIVLADEVNRATPKTQSALLEAMQERTVSAGSQTMALPEPFFVLATQNPIEMEGTYPLPEAQLDRFLLKVLVSHPNSEELHEIIARTTGNVEPVVDRVAGGSDVLKMIRTSRAVPMARAVTDYAIRLVLSGHPSAGSPSEMVARYVRYGPGPRAVQALVSAARVRALVQGRLNVSFGDIAYVAPSALRHRIILGFEGQAEGIPTGDVVGDLLKRVPEAEQ